MIKKITSGITLVILFYIVSVSAQVQMACQNFPPPSFCPGGIEDIIVTGTNEAGCQIYGCKSDASSITVMSPNGGEEWQIGGDYDIAWESTNIIKAIIFLQFSDGYLCPLETVDASLNHYLFHFYGGMQCPDGRSVISGPGIQQCKITIFGDSVEVNDSSDDFFRIIYAETQPAITVISPNGGERLEVGKTYDIIWNTTDYAPTGIVDLQLCDSSAILGTTLCTQLIPNFVSNTGSYYWTIPQQLPGISFTGEYVYQIEARIWPEGLTRWAEIDMSDDNFSITDNNMNSTHAADTCLEGCVCHGELTTCPKEQEDISGERTASSGNGIPTTPESVTQNKDNDIYAPEKIPEPGVQIQTVEGSRQINVTSDQIQIILKTYHVDKIELNEDSEKSVYSVGATKRVKMLALFSMQMRISAEVDAGTGDIISIKKPWWSFLVREG